MYQRGGGRLLRPIRTIGAERVAESLAGAYNGSTDEAMHGETTNGKAVHSRTNAINVDEQDERAGLVQARIPRDAPKIGRDADCRSSTRMKASE